MIMENKSQLLDALLKAIDRYGSKFFVTIGAGYAIFELAKADKVEGMTAVIAIGIITIAFFILRYLQNGNKTGMKNGG